MTVAVLFCVIRRKVVTAMVYWVQGLALIIAQKIQSRVLLFQIPLASLLTATAPAVGQDPYFVNSLSHISNSERDGDDSK